MTVCADGYEEHDSGLLSSDGCPNKYCVPQQPLPPPDVECPPVECPPGHVADIVDAVPSQQQSQTHYQAQLWHQLLQDLDASAGQRVCPPYTCHPIPDDQPVTQDKCSMTSRVFDTFDGSEYSYDVCDHILARDKTNGLWSVTGMAIAIFII